MVYAADSEDSNDEEKSRTPGQKEIGTGTPLKDDSVTPLSAPRVPPEHLAIGPGTPWNEPEEDFLATTDTETPPDALAAETAEASQPAPEAGPEPAPEAGPEPAPEAGPEPAPESAPEPAPAASFEGEEEYQENFAQALEEALDKGIAPGEIVQGKILRVDSDGVIVDVGYKSEGIIPREEFLDAAGNLTAEVGAEVAVLLKRKENRDGLMVFSKREVDRLLAWERVNNALANNTGVEGLLYDKCKGGFLVDLDGLRAFLPASHLDLRHVNDPSEYLHRRHTFKVLKMNRERGNVVVSRRNQLLAERSHQRAHALSQLTPGRLVRGVVKSLARFGAFVDLGGLDGLLRVEDMSWSRVTHPRQVVQVGQEIEALVLSVDPASKRVALGLKQKSEDPWSNVAAKYPLGSLVEAEAVSLTDFGAFLRLEEGVEGLLPISEMSWTRRVRHANEILKTGDTVQVRILAVDAAAKKITLGLKQTEPDPFVMFTESHHAGETVTGQVKSLTSYGAFVEVADGVTGLLHVSDLSWDGSIRQPAEVLKRGDTIQVKILEIHPERKKISLGLKQLGADPWEAAVRKYAVGSKVEVKVLRHSKIGVFVQLEPGIDGLIHMSQLAQGKDHKPAELPAVGSQVRAKVVRVSGPEHKIALSVRELEEDQEAAELQKYMTPNARRGVSLAELSGVDLEELKKRVSNETDERA